jgi:hypothetical protein
MTVTLNVRQPPTLDDAFTYSARARDAADSRGAKCFAGLEAEEVVPGMRSATSVSRNISAQLFSFCHAVSKRVVSGS